MATLDNDRAGAAPWLLSAPALLLSTLPPISAVFPSADNATLQPN